MINLLIKDFKLMFSKDKSMKKQLVSYLFSVLALGFFVFIELFLFTTIISKIKDYKHTPQAFLTLFLFIISLVMITLGILRAKKLFFNQKDVEQLTAHPIPNSQIILSKLILLFVTQYFTSLILTYPLFIAYGTLFYKSAVFYYLAIFYPALAFVFEMGLALILVYPFKLFIDFLKKHLLIQLVITIIVLFAFCIIYGKILSIFINLVANNNINAILNVSTITKLIKYERYFIPINFLTDSLILSRGSRFILFILIALGIFILGLCISISTFNYFRNKKINELYHTNTNITLKVTSVTKALIKKEFTILFKDSSNLFSFTGLLCVQPFLVLLIIESMNTILSSGVFSFYLFLFPNFIPAIDILLIMLFVLIIGSGANNYIAMEHKNIRLMKTIPVHYKKQLFIKAIIPYCFSMISMLITYLTLLITQNISFVTFTFGIVLTVILFTIFTIISMYEELKVNPNKPRNSFLSTLYTYALPIASFIISIILSFLSVSVYLIYLINIVLFILLGLPFVINLPKRTNKLFLEMEVVN